MVIGAAAGVLALAGVLQFLAPSLSYQINDRIAETLSGQRARKYRIALGVASGSYYHVGTVLNRYLKEKAGYELGLRPHRAAEIYYRHQDEPTSERIGRLSFVATIIGACAGGSSVRLPLPSERASQGAPPAAAVGAGEIRDDTPED